MTMAPARIPYFKCRGNRYYWEPSPALRRQGYRSLPLSPDRAAAEAEALARNRAIAAEAGADGDTPAAAPDPKSVAHMITGFLGSRFCDELAPKTIDEYRRRCETIRQWAGDQPAASITEADVERFYVSLLKRRGTYVANSTIAVLRRAFWYGKKMRYTTNNPGERPGMKAPQRQTEVILWTDDMVEAVVAAADAMGRHSIGTAVMLDYWLGQRLGDILRLPRDFALDTTFAQRKTGRQMDLPLDDLPHLQARIRAEQERQRAAKPWRRRRTSTPVIGPCLIISEATGRAYAECNFSHLFREVVDTAARGDAELGIPATPSVAGLRFMWLRHTAVTRMAEAGCEIPEICAVSGHTLKSAAQIMEHYLVRTGRMARAAFKKRLAYAEQATGTKIRLEGYNDNDRRRRAA